MWKKLPFRLYTQQTEEQAMNLVTVVTIVLIAVVAILCYYFIIVMFYHHIVYIYGVLLTNHYLWSRLFALLSA
jgi:hypothetical protein